MHGIIAFMPDHVLIGVSNYKRVHRFRPSSRCTTCCLISELPHEASGGRNILWQEFINQTPLQQEELLEK